MPSPRWAALAVVAGLLIPASTSAQDSDAEKAKQYYERGSNAFYKGNYGVALSNFKRANSLMTSGTLLYNISVSYSRLDKPKKALEFAQKAQGRDDLPEDTAVENRSRIKGYRVALKARRMVGADESDDSGETEPTAETGGGTDDAGGGGESADSGGNGLMWTGISLGIAGIGSLGGATYLNFAVSDKIEEMNAAVDAGNYKRADRLYGDITDQRLLGQILVYSGAGLIAIGSTVLIVDLVSGGGRADAVQLFGGPTRDGWRVGLDYRF